MAYEAQKKYDSVNTVSVHLKLNKGTDSVILEKFSHLDNVQGYIKSLIYNDLEDWSHIDGEYKVFLHRGGGYHGNGDVYWMMLHGCQAATLDRFYAEVPIECPREAAEQYLRREMIRKAKREGIREEQLVFELDPFDFMEEVGEIDL